MQRGMGRLGLLGIIALVSLFSIVAAADYTCPPEQQLFRISSETNAHGEFFNGAGNYLTHICYDDYFGTFTGTRDFVCSPTNRPIIRLSDVANTHTNAHAEISTRASPGYLDVCFDSSLSCSPIAAPAACPAGYQEIVSLSSGGNAHLGRPNFYNRPGSYRICCTTGAALPQCRDGTDNDGDLLVDYPADPGCINADDDSESDLAGPGVTNFTLVQWQDNAGAPLGRPFGTSTAVNRTVRIISSTYFPVGTNLTFEIWEYDPIRDDHIRDFSVLTTAGSPVSQALIASYKITDADIEKGRSQANDQDRGEASEEFYLKVYTTNRGISSEVNVTSIVDVSVMAPTNTPPRANITAPVHRGIYYNETSVAFIQSSTDLEGGALTYLWTIQEDGFTTPNATFTYPFRSAGQKTITLRVTDDQGAWDEDQIAVIVVASPGLFTFINKPSHQAVVVNGTLHVLVNASDSYALNSQGTCPSSMTVTCLAGVCPSQTQNTPLGCPPSLPVQNTPRGFYELYFDWNFNDGDGAPNADGYGATTITKQFGQPSSTLTDYKRADVLVNYTNSTVPGGAISLARSTNRFFTLLDARQCINDGSTWVEYNSTTGQILGSWSTRQANDRCTGANGLAGDADDCCPARYTCSGTAPSRACIPVNESRCSDYLARTPCRDDSFNVIRTDPSWDAECSSGRATNGTIVQCHCAWRNSTVQTGPYCVFSKSYNQGSFGGTGSSCSAHRCNYLPTSAPTECVNGYASVTVQAEFLPGTCPVQPGAREACLAGTGPRTILCGRPSVSLGFFGPWQFVITFAIILLISFIGWIRKRP